jgi:putative acetyltransferase
MIKILRTNSENPDFIALVKLLDAYLAVLDGEDHLFYAQFNKIDKIMNVVLAYENETPVACGAIKEFMTGTIEVKRMYVSPTSRKMGIASSILSELENWAHELSYTKSILETGTMQKAAIGLYLKSGYKVIPNYGQYAGVENSICFEKKLY